MFEGRLLLILSHPRAFAVFEIFDDLMENNLLNFGERIRRGGEEIINCISNKKEVGIVVKVSGIRGEMKCIESCQKFCLSSSS